MSWLWKNLMLVLIYVAFLVSTGLYVRNQIKYSDLENWPWVNAEMVGETGSVSTMPVENRTGAGSMLIDTRSVRFEYSLQGKRYSGDLASPDGGGLPLNPTFQAVEKESNGHPLPPHGGKPLVPWRAYYKPSSPEIAVINPIPYRGMKFLYTAAVSGLLVLIHLYFALPGLLVRMQRNSRKQAPAG